MEMREGWLIDVTYSRSADTCKTNTLVAGAHEVLEITMISTIKTSVEALGRTTNGSNDADDEVGDHEKYSKGGETAVGEDLGLHGEY